MKRKANYRKVYRALHNFKQGKIPLIRAVRAMQAEKWTDGSPEAIVSVMLRLGAIKGTLR